MKPYKILIIEDDPVIQGEMETLLRGNGYTAVSVKDFSKVTDTFKAEEPHLILLDIKLPNESGFSICSKIRSISNVPIIFVTSCNTDMDELNSIMLGGDAFITKPYNTAILLAKIAALLRRVYASEQSEILTWNDATLHLESSMIEYKGQKAELTKNELKILYYLFKSAGKICSRNDMVDGERRPMNAICDTTAKSETISVKGCKVKITYASADTDCLDAIQKLLQTTILRTAGHTAA